MTVIRKLASSAHENHYGARGNNDYFDQLENRDVRPEPSLQKSCGIYSLNSEDTDNLNVQAH